MRAFDLFTLDADLQPGADDRLVCFLERLSDDIRHRNQFSRAFLLGIQHDDAVLRNQLSRTRDLLEHLRAVADHTELQTTAAHLILRFVQIIIEQIRRLCRDIFKLLLGVLRLDAHIRQRLRQNGADNRRRDG